MRLMDQEKALPTADEIYRLVKENNQMLKAMRRDAFVKGILGFVWWIFILIVLPYISWLFIQPYIKSITDAAQGVQNTQNSINSSIQGLPDLNKLLQQLSGG
jgi:hypothetical protein